MTLENRESRDSQEPSHITNPAGGRARCSVGRRETKAGMCHKTKKMSVYDRPIKHLEGSIVWGTDSGGKNQARPSPVGDGS